MAGAPAAQSGNEEEPDASGRLQRLAPVEIQTEEGALRPVLRAPMDLSLWRARLTTADLDEREAHLDELLRRARIDPFARTFLERLARNAEETELRWTARLALRELEPLGSVAMVGVPPDLFSLEAAMEGVVSEMLGTVPDMIFALPQRTRLRIATPLPPRTEGSGDRSVVVRKGTNGVRVVVTEVVDGAPRERVLEGATLEEVLERHPRLADMVEIPIDALPGGFEMRVEVVEGGGLGRELLTPFAYGDRWREGRDPSAWFLLEELGDLLSPQGSSQPVRTDVLGVRVRALGSRECQHLGLPSGLRVTSTAPGTIAHVMGVTAGDVLLRLNGAPLRRPQDLTDGFEARSASAPLVLLWIDELGQRQVVTWRPDAPEAAEGPSARAGAVRQAEEPAND